MFGWRSTPRILLPVLELTFLEVSRYDKLAPIPELTFSQPLHAKAPLLTSSTTRGMLLRGN